MSALCLTCGDPHNSCYHNCPSCRAEWRKAKRKPGGPAEQKEALAALVAAARDMARMLQAVQLSAGLGPGQIKRLAVARDKIDRAAAMLEDRR